VFNVPERFVTGRCPIWPKSFVQDSEHGLNKTSAEKTSIRIKKRHCDVVFLIPASPQILVRHLVEVFLLADFYQP
jgi:hypothetical protein